MKTQKTHGKNITHRLKIARGHLEKILTMAEDGTYCIDVINQSRAVQHALREVDSILLENHLKTCVIDFVKKGRTQESVDEIMRIFKNGR